MFETAPGSAKKISALAKRMSALSLGVGILCLGGFVLVWTNASWAGSALRQWWPEATGFEITAGNRAMLMFITAIPLALLLLALWQIKRFFDGYRSGDLFPKSSGRLLRSVGALFVALAIINPMIRTLTMLVLTWNLGEGKKQLMISLSSTDLVLVMLAGLLVMIGHVLAEASRLSDDNQQII